MTTPTRDSRIANSIIAAWSKVYDNCPNVDLLAIKLANLFLYAGRSDEKLTIARINDANILSLYGKKAIWCRKLWIASFYIAYTM